MSTLSAPNHLTTTGTKQRPCDNCSPPLPPLPTPAPTPRPTPTPTLPPLPTPVIMIYERRHPATTADINIDRRHKTIDQFTCRSNSIRTRYAAHNNVITDRPMTHALTVSVNIQRSHLSHVLYGSKLARRFFVLIRTTCYKCVIIASIDNRLRGTISKTPAPPPPPLPPNDPWRPHNSNRVWRYGRAIGPRAAIHHVETRMHKALGGTEPHNGGEDLHPRHHRRRRHRIMARV